MGTFDYNITASTAGGDPTSFAAIDLPAGLSFLRIFRTNYRNPHPCRSFSIPLVVNYGNDDGNLTDLDSANDQLGSLSAPVNIGDPEQVLLNLSIQAVPPSVATLAATSISSTQATLQGNVTASVEMHPRLPSIMEPATVQTMRPIGITPSSWDSSD